MPFAKQFSRSWMSEQSHVGELDKLVTGRLFSTLSAYKRTTQPPLAFRLLLRQLARHVAAGSPFEIACDCALLGELVFTRGRGGIYKLTDSTTPMSRNCTIRCSLLAIERWWPRGPT